MKNFDPKSVLVGERPCCPDKLLSRPQRLNGPFSKFRILVAFIMPIAMSACQTPTVMVYSSGFSFANYDFVAQSQTGGLTGTTSLYGMDIEFANLLSRYNMKVIGIKEAKVMELADQKRVLLASFSLTATAEENTSRIVLGIHFDDYFTGRKGASITAWTKGNIFNPNGRSAAFAKASVTLIRALEKDKGLRISD